MNPAHQIILSGLLSFGVPLLIAVYELIALRRQRRGGDDGPSRARPPIEPGPGGGAARPLPACLVPNPTWRAPQRMRELA